MNELEKRKLDWLHDFKIRISIKSRSDKTVYNYCSVLKKFLFTFQYNIQRATSSQLSEYILNSGGRSTMAQTHTTLNLFYSLVLKQKNKVAKYIPYPEKTKHLPHAPAHEQVLGMIDNEDNAKYKLIIRLLYETGIRVSELCNLGCGDINNNLLSIHVSGKKNKDRWIPITQDTLNALLDYCDKCDTKTIFNINSHTVRWAVNRAALNIGLDNITPLMLRQSFMIELAKTQKAAEFKRIAGLNSFSFCADYY